MSSTRAVAVQVLGATQLSAAQTRVVEAALGLFAEHGVSGTSLQMIADAIGVTKAAVYHQFNAKEQIVVAAVEFELLRLEDALDAAEAARGDEGALETLLAQVIELAVERRRMVATLMYDPVIIRLLREHEPFQVFMERLYGALLGESADAHAHLRVAMITSAIGGAVTHPLVADLDPPTLRAQLVDLTRLFLAIDT